MTDSQRAAFEAWYDTHDPRTPQSPFDRELACKAWQAALASPEVQALRKDAERYRLLRRGQHWSVTDGIGDTLQTEALDAAIDHARRIEGDGK